MEATQKPRLFVAAFLACITLFATRSSTADAKDTGGNVVSYQCDIANDKLIVSYNTPLDGSAIDYNMDALIGSDGPNFVLFEDVTKSCILKSGLYLVVIHSSGWPNVQGECGGEGPTGGVIISRGKRQLVALDFDHTCIPNFPAVAEVIISGKAGDMQIIKAKTINDD